jgi:acyl carrier protein
VVPAQRLEVVTEFLQAEVARTLGMDGSTDVDTDQGLFEMGLDSLMSLELKKRIERAVGARLPSTLTFNYPTIDALAGFLLDAVVPAPIEALDATEADGSTDADAEGAPPTPAASGDDLTEDELAALLAERLTRLHPMEGAR